VERHERSVNRTYFQSYFMLSRPVLVKLDIKERTLLWVQNREHLETPIENHDLAALTLEEIHHAFKKRDRGRPS
jgi:hypothetical protein